MDLVDLLLGVGLLEALISIGGSAAEGMVTRDLVGIAVGDNCLERGVPAGAGFGVCRSGAEVFEPGRILAESFAGERGDSLVDDLLASVQGMADFWCDGERRFGDQSGDVTPCRSVDGWLGVHALGLVGDG